jgi:hypothetical protein
MSETALKQLSRETVASIRSKHEVARLASRGEQVLMARYFYLRRGRLLSPVLCVCLALIFTGAERADAQLKAFPQAEGAGAAATGGRGGSVYHVTSLADTNTVGTLRYGVTSFSPGAPVTIVFDVGGWINLSSNLGITRSNVTLAGQTAPGGIGVRGGKFSVGGDDIVVRHMRFKPGKDSGRNDSVNTNVNAERVIYDHISTGYSWDENFSVQATDVTLQYSSVSHGLQDHSAGSLLENPHRLTMHHNLYAHNDTRNPKHRVHETLDWVDNVIYNWNDRALYMQATDSVGYFWTSNIDGNYFIAGPNQGNTRPISGGSLDDYGTWFGTNAYDSDKDNVHNGQEYVHGQANFSNFSSAVTSISNTPYPVADAVWKDASPQAAYERTLAEFGATPWDRDEVDTLLRNQVVNRTGSQISHENQLVALGITNGGYGTLGSGTLPTDTDKDGMPDAWETKHGLLVNRPSNNADFDNDGFTDLEEYLNEVAAFKATGAIEFIGSGRYARSENWTRRWEPSRFDDVNINSGVATVDAVGQKAGSLRIGATAAANGRLDIKSGWLEVTDELVIGENSAATAVLDLSGGELSTPELSKSSGGQFNFTGGVLHADVVNFDMVNSGGTISPGHSIGQSHIVGNLTLESGSLAIELASTALADTLIVDGNLTLGGALKVSFLDGFAPTLGDNWQIVAAGKISGVFSSLPDGFSLRQMGTNLQLFYGPAVPEPTTLLLFASAAQLSAVFVAGRRVR